MVCRQRSGSPVPGLRKGDEMKGQREERPIFVNGSQAAPENERRKEDRRKQACEGYWYIEMVGWMDRRESVRRKDSNVS